MNLRRAPRRQRQYGATRRAARPQQHGAFAGQRIIAQALAQGFRQAQGVGIAAFHMPVAEHQQIDRAGLARRIVQAFGQGEGRFLVRHRHIDAAKAGAADRIDHHREVLGTHRQRHHRPVDAMLRQPMAMQQRRQRMRHRPADNSRQFRLARQGHDSSTPSLRSAASSGSSGNPSTEK